MLLSLPLTRALVVLGYEDGRKGTGEQCPGEENVKESNKKKKERSGFGLCQKEKKTV